MERRSSAAGVALLVVTLVATLTAVGAMTWALQHDRHADFGSHMMTVDRESGPGGWDGPWHSMMGRFGMASESDYLAEMVAHHQEAVAAAGELARSDRSEMRAFGASIVESQSAQIRLMQGWLREWYPQRPPEVDYAPMMRDLSGLTGDALDEAFLHDMIGHHMAAVMMSQHLLVRGTDHPEVAELARSIRDVQHAEIVQMRRWLAQWFDTGWRGGAGRAGPWAANPAHRPHHRCAGPPA